MCVTGGASGRVFAWGRCDEGALGMGEMRPRVSVRKPTRIPFGDNKIKHVGCGARHTVIVTEKGIVFSMGRGDRFNFAGGGSYHGPQMVEGLTNVFPSQVYCGNNFSMVLVNKSKVPYSVPWTIIPPPIYQKKEIVTKSDGAFKNKVKVNDWKTWESLKVRGNIYVESHRNVKRWKKKRRRMIERRADVSVERIILEKLTQLLPPPHSEDIGIQTIQRREAGEYAKSPRRHMVVRKSAMNGEIEHDRECVRCSLCKGRVCVGGQMRIGQKSGKRYTLSEIPSQISPLRYFRYLNPV